jgi:hypothetical protein
MFVPTIEAALLLKSKPTHIRWLNKSSLLPYLVTPSGARLFVTAYIEAYAKFLNDNELPLTKQSAKAFAATPEAQRIDREAKAQFNLHITSKEYFLRSDIVSLLGVNYAAIRSWIRSGKLQADNERSPMSSAAIQRACKWQNVRV